MARKSSVQIQSPDLPSKTDRAGPSYLVQLNKIVDKKSEPELYKVLSKQPGEHAHHIAILETLAPLFNNLNEAGQRVLRNYINQDQAIGNHIRNLINIPGELHQGGIHEFARREGYEIDSKKEPTGLAKEILAVSQNGTVKQRMAAAQRYLKEAVPEMKHYINDALTKHYKRKEARERVSNYMLTDATLG